MKTTTTEAGALASNVLPTYLSGFLKRILGQEKPRSISSPPLLSSYRDILLWHWGTCEECQRMNLNRLFFGTLCGLISRQHKKRWDTTGPMHTNIHWIRWGPTR